MGDSGQLVHLRIVAVNRPQLTRGAGVPRSFPVERSHRAPAARLPASAKSSRRICAEGKINTPLYTKGRKRANSGGLDEKL